jgi:hypothetical protein
MAFDFPNSPSVGTVYTSPTGTAYTWDGEKWTSGTGYGNIYIADSAPAAPVGSLWWESDTGILYVYYNDGNSTQWVAISGGIFDAVRYGAAQTLTTNQRAQARANIDVTKKNYIINGAMMISQENGSAVTANNGYPVDQFIVSWNPPATYSVQQIALATPGGSPNRLRATTTGGPGSIGASDYFMFFTNLEGLRTADLLLGTSLAKTITIQFGCRCSQAGTYNIGIRNGANNRSYFTTYTISAGEVNTDVIRSVTIALDQTGTWPVDNTASMRVFWAPYCGSSLIATTPNAWIAGNFIAAAAGTNIANGGTFDLFDVGLYEGSVAPLFQVPDYASELALCMRYYQQQSGANMQVVGVTDSVTVNVPILVPLRPGYSVTFPYTDATFSGSGVPPAGTWGLQAPNVASVTKSSGTFTINAISTAPSLCVLQMFGAILSRTSTILVQNANMAPIKLNARL